jgi:hypothetical protein
MNRNFHLLLKSQKVKMLFQNFNQQKVHQNINFLKSKCSPGHVLKCLSQKIQSISKYFVRYQNRVNNKDKFCITILNNSNLQILNNNNNNNQMLLKSLLKQIYQKNTIH